jgi:Spy/CpxP family protein refolding chaperone
MKKVFMLMAAGILVAGMAMAQQQPPGGPPVQVREGHQLNVTVTDSKLNLTPEQKTQIEKLRIEMQQKNIPLESKIRLARLEIEQVMLSEKPDKAKIAKQMKEISDLQLQVKLNALDHRFAVRGLLTPEQLKSWQEGRGHGFGMGGSQMYRMRDGGPRGMRMMQRAGRPGMEDVFYQEVGDEGPTKVIIEKQIENN